MAKTILDDLREAIALEAVAECEAVLQALREWDHLPLMGDGPYFIRRIDKALAAIRGDERKEVVEANP